MEYPSHCNITKEGKKKKKNRTLSIVLHNATSTNRFILPFELGWPSSTISYPPPEPFKTVIRPTRILICRNSIESNVYHLCWWFHAILIIRVVYFPLHIDGFVTLTRIVGDWYQFSERKYSLSLWQPIFYFVYFKLDLLWR